MKDVRNVKTGRRCRNEKWVGPTQVRWKAAGNRGTLLKSLCTDLLMGTLGSRGGMETWEVPETHGETELCGLRARSGETAAIVLVLSSSPMQPMGRHQLSCVEPSPNRAKSESALTW